MDTDKSLLLTPSCCMGAKHGLPQSSSALALMHLTCGHYARSWGYHILAMWRMWKSEQPPNAILSVPPGHWQTFATLWTYCPQLLSHHRAVAAVTRGLPPDWKRPLGRPSHTWLRAVEADFGQQNIGLASWRKAAIRDDWRRIMDTATLQRSML